MVLQGKSGRKTIIVGIEVYTSPIALQSKIQPEGSVGGLEPYMTLSGILTKHSQIQNIS